MKHFRFVVLAIIICYTGTLFARNAFRFKERKHDFGVVQDTISTLQFTFELQNFSDEPAMISTIVKGCSCLSIEEYTQDSIRPGEWGTIKMALSTIDIHGAFEKPANVRDHLGNVYYISMLGSMVSTSDSIVSVSTSIE